MAPWYVFKYVCDVGVFLLVPGSCMLTFLPGSCLLTICLPVSLNVLFSLFQIHAMMLEQQYHNLLDERQEKRERARMFRRQVGRLNGPDRNVLARTHELDAEAVSDLLSGACADVFPNAQQTYPNQNDHSIGRDTVPVRYGTAYNSHGGSLNGGHHGGLFSHRSKHGAHHTSPIAPPVREIGLYYDTCWWYSLCNFQYRPH